MWEHAVAILIGGYSRRMGSQKQNIKLPSGQTMLECMVAFARDLSEKMVVVGGEVEHFRCIQDRRNDQGPLAGIEALLMSNIDSRYLVVGCDMPNLSLDLVSPLLKINETAIYVNRQNIISLPLVISSTAANACTAYLDSGKKSIRGFVQSIPHTKISIENERGELLRSINTPDDLNKLTIK